MYGFGRLALELNEWEEGTCPTDARRRPDVRLMEQGDWDASNHSKLILEDKQRAARRRMELGIVAHHFMLPRMLCFSCGMNFEK